MENLRAIKAAYRLASDPGDKWGSAMAWLFAVCDFLQARDVEIPQEWRFSPSPFGPETEGHELSVLGLYPPHLVKAFGRVLFRYTNRLERAGLDY